MVEEIIITGEFDVKGINTSNFSKFKQGEER